ncbi:MAG TPA: ABC transporter ATP-binding protein [Gemmatimonadaceae bacterium]|jgi:molybdopterin-binding protein|nr:ABC transporter ATP-binding protein [Gemmatimonadaceae bacterium]
MIKLDRVTTAVGNFTLRDVSFAIDQGSYGVVIGPAGSGKTTLLETIAGIVPVRTGQVSLRGADVTRQAPELRRIGIVYQHAYLFPHLSVADNVGYGTNDDDLAREMVERFRLDALIDRDVKSLSGGERQLVALARALATRPDILLLDEPFAALDPRSRIVVRRQVRALHAERGMTVLHVTHDFNEAGRLGHRVVLLEQGRVLQVGTPDEVFHRPASPAVAEFIGAENVVPGKVRGVNGGGPERVVEFTSGGLTLHAVSDVPEGDAHAVIRADEIALSPERRESSMRNQLDARVVELAPSGVITRVTVDANGVELVAAITTRSAEDLGLAPGRDVVAALKATAVHLC